MVPHEHGSRRSHGVLGKHRLCCGWTLLGVDVTDRELLEFAAKSTGEYMNPEVLPDAIPVVFMYCGKPWNPLTDDGDALRLAVRLNLHMGLEDNVANVWKGGMFHWSTEKHNDDPEAATRRAIVRTAAYIGKAMK